jgi:hypothetical protein
MDWHDLVKYVKSKYGIVMGDECKEFARLVESLFVHNIVPDLDGLDGANIHMVYNIYGLYYGDVTKDYDLMKKYYLMAIDKQNSGAMNNLGYYYRHIEKDYDLMKKYYLMAIDKQDSDAMSNLGYYYQQIEIDYDLMKKYYLMAIDKQDSYAMNNLGCYYLDTEIDYDLMKKYYLMAYENGYNKSLDDIFLHESNDLAKYNYIKANRLQASYGYDKYDVLRKALIEEGLIITPVIRFVYTDLCVVCVYTFGNTSNTL